MSDETRDVSPITSPTEKVLDLIALVTSAVPYLGGPVGNFFAGVSAGRKFSRVREALEDLADNLKDFENEASTSYVKSDDFEDLLEETLHRIAHERNEEKRRIYRDFLLDAIKSPGKPYDEQIRFLRTLEEIQADHIKVIRALLQEPDPHSRLISGSPIGTLDKRLPDTDRKRIEDLVSQLNDMRVTDLTSTHVMMTGHDAENLQHSITPYGQRFVQFILRIDS